ncbi:MAG: hypothetical protein WCV99_13420 [Sterolibacterium sp.]|jgi:hypothetical protein
MNAPEQILRIGDAGSKFKHWTTTEDAIFREIYPQQGPQAVAQRLPNRTLASIYSRAASMGLKAPAVSRRWAPGKAKWRTTDAIDAEIRRTYQAPIGSGEVNDLARRVMRPRWWVCKRATTLGLITPRFKEPPWTEAEDTRLDALTARGHTTSVIARKMREAGFNRTETACVVRMKRIGIARGGDGTEAWSATALAKLMGVDSSTVSKRWIPLEGLPAKKRGTDRTAAQGGDEWLITRDGLRRWLKDHAQCIDLRKVDKFFFWSVVFN